MPINRLPRQRRPSSGLRPPSPEGGRLILTFSITPKGRRRVCPAAALLWVCYSLDLVEVGVNGAVILGLCAGVIAGLCTGLLALCLSGLLVDLLADGVESLLQVILLCLDVVTLGFNRYIVECKYRFGRCDGGEYWRFNRYIVECK